MPRTISIVGPRTVNESTKVIFTITHRDHDGVLYTPGYCRWKLYGLTSGLQQVQWTEFGGGDLDSEMEIEVDSSKNDIIVQTNDFERMLLTVDAYAASSEDRVYEEYEYRIKNLQKVT